MSMETATVEYIFQVVAQRRRVITNGDIPGAGRRELRPEKKNTVLHNATRPTEAEDDSRS